ncbi:MAG TPA: xyloglucanase [Candidatus Nitrosopolaris sp.]|nr:xyloglucanase [Candidatus Nitrosopolaris sp.]
MKNESNTLVMLVCLCAGFGLSGFHELTAADPARVPSEPYVWRNVVIGGGGFVDGIVFHPMEKDLVYARTDVGGAYRWDAKAGEWVPLNDWLSPSQNNYTGIESIALDPSDPNRVYLAAGTYTQGEAAILSSDDQGRTFKITPVAFKMGGNADGRSNGERLAVDPNDGAILFFGSRNAGLWKSTDHGESWNVVDSFAKSSALQPTPPSTTNPSVGRRGWGNTDYGIVSVVFDASSGKRGTPTPVIYAAVSTTGTNLYRSDDAGANWGAVAGQPIGLRPNHLVRSVDGLFYLSYSSVPGPNNVNDGALWKYNPKDGSWTNISPEKPAEGQPLGWGYGAVCVDAKHPSTIMATTIDRWGLKDEVFRSTDGGATWEGILAANGKLDYSMAPYTGQGHTPHWTGSVSVNPNNPDQVLFGTGYGIWASLDATKADVGEKVTWVFLDKGLEETVPLALISPPTGAHLLSGVGDVDGFRHEDVNVSPPEGSYSGPGFNHTRNLTYAGGKPEVIVRLGDGGKSRVHVAISEDGGKTWSALHNNAPGGNGREGETVAVAADGGALVWSPRGGTPSVTFNRGTTWTACQGLAGGAVVIADPVNPSRFYGFAAQSGKLLVSTDGAVSFEETAASLPAMQRFGARDGGVFTATTGMEANIWVGSRDSALYHSADGGVTFTRLEQISGADALGFGKAAPGKTFPAVYLLGTINQLHARYRSGDAGQTWVRIDDDQHQFATADTPMIIGDPRIYGRVYITTGGRGVIYGTPAGNTH